MALCSLLETPRVAKTFWHHVSKAWFDCLFYLNITSTHGSSPLSTLILKIDRGDQYTLSLRVVVKQHNIMIVLISLVSYNGGGAVSGSFIASEKPSLIGGIEPKFLLGVHQEGLKSLGK